MKVEVYGCREKDMNLIGEARAGTKRVEIETASQLSVTVASLLTCYKEENVKKKGTNIF